MSVDIFISYSHKDRSLVENLAELLEEEFLIWWDEDLIGGENFEDSIFDRLGRVGITIVVVSKHSINSEWVNAESREALDNSQVIPLIIGDQQLPDHLKNLNAIKLDQNINLNSQTSFHKLQRDIRVHLQNSKNNSNTQDARLENVTHYENIRAKVGSLLQFVIVVIVCLVLLFLFQQCEAEKEARSIETELSHNQKILSSLELLRDEGGDIQSDLKTKKLFRNKEFPPPKYIHFLKYPVGNNPTECFSYSNLSNTNDISLALDQVKICPSKGLILGVKDNRRLDFFSFTLHSIYPIPNVVCAPNMYEAVLGHEKAIEYVATNWKTKYDSKADNTDCIFPPRTLLNFDWNSDKNSIYIHHFKKSLMAHDIFSNVVADLLEQIILIEYSLLSLIEDASVCTTKRCLFGNKLGFCPTMYTSNLLYQNWRKNWVHTTNHAFDIVKKYCFDFDHSIFKSHISYESGGNARIAQQTTKYVFIDNPETLKPEWLKKIEVGKYVEARNFLEESVKAKNSRGLVPLAIFYDQAIGGNQDLLKARHLLEIAANSENLVVRKIGRYNLGISLIFGRGGIPDIALGKAYLLEGIDLGLNVTHFRTLEQTINGNIVSQTFSESFRELNLLAKKGDSISKAIKAIYASSYVSIPPCTKKECLNIAKNIASSLIENGEKELAKIVQKGINLSAGELDSTVDILQRTIDIKKIPDNALKPTLTQASQIGSKVPKLNFRQFLKNTMRTAMKIIRNLL